MPNNLWINIGYSGHSVLEAAAATGLRLLSEENGWSMHAMSFNPGHVHQSEQSGMPPPHTLLPPMRRRHATIHCTQGCHSELCSEKQCGLVSLIIGLNQGQQTHGPEPHFGEFNHFMQGRLCKQGSLGPLCKFIEYCRIIELIPVIPLGIRNNWQQFYNTL